MEKKVATGYLAVVFGIYVFFMHNRYYDISWTKLLLLAVATAVCLIWILLMKENIDLKKMNLTDKFMAGVLVSEAIAFAISADKSTAFTGSTEHFFGFYGAMILISAYVLLRVSDYSKKVFLFIAAIAYALAVIFSMIQFVGIDPLNMFTRMDSTEIANFLGPLGNTGFLGQYIVVMLPVVMAGLLEEDRLLNIVSIICAGFGIVGVGISNTDATVIGFVLVVIFLLKIFGQKIELLDKFGGYLIVSGVFALIARIIINRCENARNLNTIESQILNEGFGMVLMVIGLLIHYFCTAQNGREIRSKIACKISTVLFWIGICAIGVAVLSVVICTILNPENLPEKLARYLIFDDNWGTGRGFLWKTALKYYAGEHNLLKWIFGVGQGQFALDFMQTFQEEMFAFDNRYYNDCHNVLIQFMITRGAFGAICLVGAVVTAIRSGLKNENVTKRLFSVAVLAGSITICMSISQMITPIFVVCLMALTKES